MKKLLLISLCLMATTVFAAPRLGIKAGLNFANIDEDMPDRISSYNTTTRSGIILGAWAEIPLVALENLTVRTDVLYTQKGAKYDAFDYDVTVIADELTINPFLVYYFPTKVIRPFLEAGPELGLTLADGEKYEGNRVDSDGNWSETNFSVNVGGGVEFSLGGNSLFVEARYNQGLTDMGTWSPYFLDDGQINTKTNGIQLLAGIELF